MSKNEKNNDFTAKEAALRLNVHPSDIIEWIEKGRIKAYKSDKGDYFIKPNNLQKFANSMPEELRFKIGEYLFAYQKGILPEVQQDVSERFKFSTDIVLNRAELAVQLLESLHKKYEKKIDIFKEKNGAVASFIVYARVISLLYSLIDLLRSSIPAESSILFRPLWEAILLAQYFSMSMASNENQGVIRRWFDKEKSPKASDVRYFIAKKMNKPVDNMRDLHNQFSKPVHHSYKAIMQSYRAYQMSGFLGDHRERFGFDYHKSSIIRDVVILLFDFEPLLLNSLGTFKFCFIGLLQLDRDDYKSLESEINFYRMDSEKRFEIIVKNNELRQAEKNYNIRNPIVNFFYRIIKGVAQNP